MLDIRVKRAATLVLMMAMILLGLVPGPVRAADHKESTSVTQDPPGDLGDSFIFLNPSDNSRVVLAMTLGGFIPPQQSLNAGYFPDDILFRFEIENTGDAIPDRFIDIDFSPQTARNVAQIATVYPEGVRSRVRFRAPATVGTLAPTPNPFVVTTNATHDMKFFAGLTDDPFYFDIPAFGRFVASVLGGVPNPAVLNRARDSFAGYNNQTIAIEMPAAALRGPAGNIVGMNAVTLRRENTIRSGSGVTTLGEFVQVDRAAVPAVNTALIPFPRKNEFNRASTLDDAQGRFAGDIVGTLTALGTSQANIAILASVAVANGDILRLNLATPNTSQGFGERITTPNYTGFPNGRRIGDDTIDTLLYFITNQALVNFDNVNSNEVPLTNTFPFFGLPHQPFEGTVDDRTRN